LTDLGEAKFSQVGTFFDERLDCLEIDARRLGDEQTFQAFPSSLKELDPSFLSDQERAKELQSLEVLERHTPFGNGVGRQLSAQVEMEGFEVWAQVAESRVRLRAEDWGKQRVPGKIDSRVQSYIIRSLRSEE
jgi:hypothetical protein